MKREGMVMTSSRREWANEVLAFAALKLRRGEISRRRFMQFAAAFGAAAALPSTGTFGQASGDTLKFLVGESFWANWHPYNHTAQIGYKIQRNLFSRLVEVQPDMSLAAGLAESWEQLDELTWEFKLRPGVTFHSGAPLTAADVKASIELASGFVASDPALAMTANWVPHEGIVVDDLTIQLKAASPFGPLLNTLAYTDILSAADIEAGAEALEAKPNGTGAFMLTGDEPNTKTLTRFEDHWRGPAKLSSMTWEFIQDAQTRLSALLAGQAHVIDRVVPDQRALIDGNADVALISVTAPEIQSIWFRMDKDPLGGNLDLRKAIAWGLDRESMAALVGGNTLVADSHLAEGIEYRAAQSPMYSFDPDRARAALEAAGGPVAFELASPTGFYPKAEEINQLIQQNLNEIGFDMKLTLLELGAWIDMLFGESKPGEAFYGGWGNITRDPDFAVATLLHSPGAWTGAHDPKSDELIEAGKASSDPEERARIYGELQTHLWNDLLPSIPILYSDLTSGYRTNVQGYELYPTAVQDFWPVEIS
jgi:peptide/nickel transport system substrate-binding protein